MLLALINRHYLSILDLVCRADNSNIVQVVENKLNKVQKIILDKAHLVVDV